MIEIMFAKNDFKNVVYKIDGLVVGYCIKHPISGMWVLFNPDNVYITSAKRSSDISNFMVSNEWHIDGVMNPGTKEKFPSAEVQMHATHDVLSSKVVDGVKIYMMDLVNDNDDFNIVPKIFELVEPYGGAKVKLSDDDTSIHIETSSYVPASVYAIITDIVCGLNNN